MIFMSFEALYRRLNRNTHCLGTMQRTVAGVVGLGRIPYQQKARRGAYILVAMAHVAGAGIAHDGRDGLAALEDVIETLVREGASKLQVTFVVSGGLLALVPI